MEEIKNKEMTAAIETISELKRLNENLKKKVSKNNITKLCRDYSLSDKEAIELNIGRGSYISSILYLYREYITTKND